MPDIPNPAAVPGIMPSELGDDRDRRPDEGEPHFGNNDDSGENRKGEKDRPENAHSS